MILNEPNGIFAVEWKLHDSGRNANEVLGRRMVGVNDLRSHTPKFTIHLVVQTFHVLNSSQGPVAGHIKEVFFFVNFMLRNDLVNLCSDSFVKVFVIATDN